LFADYQPNFEDALVEFCSSHWPCEFSHPKKGRCVNVSKRHEKGHQNDRGRVTNGAYVSNFTADNYKNRWLNLLKARLRDAQEDLEREEDGAEATGPLGPIRRLHARNISDFYRDVGGASKFNSHATCLCCLMRPPEHVLRCGHVLCTVSDSLGISNTVDRVCIANGSHQYRERDITNTLPYRSVSKHSVQSRIAQSR
jgi:hypothetical protein